MSKVSVILPVYNTRQYLSKSIESILNQTFQDFTLVIIDDGSSDGSAELIKEYACRDKRVMFKSRENMGLVATLNESLDWIDSEYIAREDSDDYSHKDRLKEQVEFLDANPKVGICGCYNKYFGNSKNLIRYPVTDEEARPWLLFGPPVAHPSVMLRAKVLFDNNLRYEFDYPYCEDYRLWQKMSKYCQISNIPKVLHYYREHDGQISEQNRNTCWESHVKLARPQWESMGWSGSDSELLICLGKKSITTKEYVYITSCFEQLLARNRVYDKQALGRMLGERLMKYLIVNIGCAGMPDFKKCSLYEYSDKNMVSELWRAMRLIRRSFINFTRSSLR